MTLEKEVNENGYWLGPDKFAPVPTHVASALIRPIDKGKLKAVALETVEKQAHEQIAMLKKQADLILEQVKRIEERVKISAEIYQADLGFEPVIGHQYHLYENEIGNRKLSMIGPNEWNTKSSRLWQFLATVKLNADRSWDVVKMA